MLRFKPASPHTQFRFYPQMKPSGSFPNLANKSFSVNGYARYKAGDEGVLVSCGDAMGGYALYIQDGRLKFHFNFFNKTRYSLKSEPLEDGDLKATFDFVLTGENKGICRLRVNDRTEDHAEIECRPLFYARAPLTIGRLFASPICRDMPRGSYFNYSGTIRYVEYLLEKPADYDDSMTEMMRELHIQ
jgi:arylsulfatase